MLKKKIWPIKKKYRTFYPKNCHTALKNIGLGIRDPGSGKNLFRISDPGVKKAPDPDPQLWLASRVGGEWGNKLPISLHYLAQGEGLRSLPLVLPRPTPVGPAF
jgi:hypothetical protein